MSLLAELQELLAPKIPKRQRAVVVNADTRNVNVVINGKPKTFVRTASDGTNYRAGDGVFVQGDVLIGRSSLQKSKTFYV